MVGASAALGSVALVVPIAAKAEGEYTSIFTDGGTIGNITLFLLLEWPRPSAWPSSCRISVRVSDVLA